jgi:hypothetical protein
MRTLTFILWMLGMNFAPQPRTDKQPFVIVIAAENSVITPGADVWIKVSLTNSSNRNLDDSGSYSGQTGLDTNFQFDVRDQKGELVSKRRYEHPELATGTPINRTLRPGEIVTQKQRVSSLYDMTQPGKYTVQVSMPIPKGLGIGSVKSNSVTVTIRSLESPTGAKR